MKFVGIIALPLAAIPLFIAAILEPTFVGELSWLWWFLGAIGVTSAAGWILRHGSSA